MQISMTVDRVLQLRTKETVVLLHDNPSQEGQGGLQFDVVDPKLQGIFKAGDAYTVIIVQEVDDSQVPANVIPLPEAPVEALPDPTAAPDTSSQVGAA